MQPIRALSLAPDVNNWLANSRQPRILHVFDHACNLINERRLVLSVVTPHIGNGPFNLVIPRLRKSVEMRSDLDVARQTSEVFSDTHGESAVSIRGNQLTLGSLVIDTSNALLWSPRPAWEMLHANRDNILKQLISLSIPNCQPHLPYSLLSTFSSALVKVDISSTLKTTSKLAGLGAGLTPAGDDFLLGAMHAAWIIHPLEQAKVITEVIAGTAAPLTTSLSAAWLRAAGRGEAGAVWHDFFNALLMADSSTVQLRIVKLLSIGHTSGADAFAGFIMTISAADDI